MSDSIRWGILGPGTIAHAFAKGRRDAPGAELVEGEAGRERRALPSCPGHREGRGGRSCRGAPGVRTWA
ncbi:MAG: hypothetical protein ACO4CZ_11675 [Planctomycetota bacterium]